MGRGNLPLIHLSGVGWLTLQEIIDAIMERYPHAASNENIIAKLNIIQRELFRTIYKPQTSTQYDILKGVEEYEIGYSPATIMSVVVNGEEYPYGTAKDDMDGCFYYIVDDSYIGLYPTPKEDIALGLTVFRYSGPAELKADKLDAIPDLDEAYHMLLVYRVCKEMAEIALDTDMANQFITQYNSLEKSFFQSRPAKPHKIKDVYGRYCW